MDKKNIVISGAGLVGSLLAVTLKKRGHEVTLFEKRPDMRKEALGGGRSINLVLTAKGLKALEDVGIKDEILQITVPVMGRMMHATNGELTYQPYGKDTSECNYSVSRSGLNKKMMDIAEDLGVNIHFQDGLKSIDFELKTAQFSQTQDVPYDLFFGTDGAGSVTRKELMKEAPREAFDKTEALGAEYKELFMPARANGEYAMEKKALHIWPRGSHMLMGLPNLDGSFTMTLYLPSEDFDKLQTKEDVKAHFEKHYPDSIPLMPEYTENFFENPRGFLGTVRAWPWTYGDSVALLGDAAHAIVPFFGQGMNSGYEDISYLGQMMDQHGDDWEKILHEYEKHQYLSGSAIADMAIENFTEMKSKVGDKNFLLRKKVEHKIENAFPAEYRSRYAMVTYTLIPYHLCQEAGKIQNEILDQLCRGINSPDELDLELAHDLIQKKFFPFLQKHNISFK